MKTYRFVRDVVCGGVKRVDGEIVSEDDIPDGSLAPLLRTGMIVEQPAESASQPAKAETSKRKPKPNE